VLTLALSAAAAAPLAACSNSSPAPAPHADTPATQDRAASKPASSTVGDAPVTTTAVTVAVSQACPLITQHEASTAAGADLGAGKAFSSHGSSRCQYGTYQTAFVLVNPRPSHGHAGYDQFHNNPALHGVDLAGVDDAAFEISGPGTAGIYLTKGDARVVVSVSIHAATTPPKGAALALAKTAASRTWQHRMTPTLLPISADAARCNRRYRVREHACSITTRPAGHAAVGGAFSTAA
jgi:hypothetical protein